MKRIQKSALDLRKRTEHIEALLKISREITGSLDLKEVLTRISDQAMHLLRAEVCSILLINDTKKALKIVMSRGLPSSALSMEDVPVGRSISGWVAQHKKALFVKDIENDPRFQKRNSEQYFTHSLISSPLVCKDELLGVININNKRSRRAFTESDLNLLKGFASLASIALHNAKLYEDLEKVYLEVINAFTSALWAKDPYTKEHSEAITNLADAIAQELGLWGRDLDMIRHACHLHDIGKIGIRDGVLQKPDKLNEGEWREMKLHPLIGAKIIRPLSFLSDVTDIVEQEHERWDGRGYPFGLKKEEIHIGARIVAVADAYDAITSDRPYHKGENHAWAVAEINRCNGTQFDPKVVEAFNRALAKGVVGINRPHPSEETESGQGLSAAGA